MQGLYILVKLSLVLIYILKVYRKKSSSIVLRKKHVPFMTCIFLLESINFLNFWKISLLKI